MGENKAENNEMSIFHIPQYNSLYSTIISAYQVHIIIQILLCTLLFTQAGAFLLCV